MVGPCLGGQTLMSKIKARSEGIGHRFLKDSAVAGA